MSLLSQFMDPVELAQLNDRQVSEISDNLDGFLVKELITNGEIQKNLKANIKPILSAVTKKG